MHIQTERQSDKGSETVTTYSNITTKLVLQWRAIMDACLTLLYLSLLKHYITLERVMKRNDSITPKLAAAQIHMDVSQWTARRALRRIGLVSATKQKKICII